MSLLDKASLVVTPNAVKESKLYSVVPSSGAGDMDVVRATTATRVNSAGLIEVVPRNLLQYSEEIDNAIYTKINFNITANAIAAPNGTTTADKVIPTTTNSAHVFYQAVPTGTYGFSIYAKAAEETLFSMWLNDLSKRAIFDLTTGTITSSNVTNSTITNVGNGWYRCTIYDTTVTSLVAVYARSGNGFAGNNSDGMYFWGAQAETSSTATEYFPTTTRLNIPRIDYTNGSCPSLLVEPQRTNITLQSENLATTWYTANGLLDSNATTSPDGTTTADKIKADTTNGIHVYQQTLTVSNATAYTMSVFVKAGEYTFFELADASSLKAQTFNLTTKTISAPQTGGFSAATSSKIEDYGNGWLRCSITYTTVGVTAFFRMSLSNGTTTSFAGNNTNGLFVWGAQFEAGSYPTSYIPTVASSVTRNADVISKTGISSLIGQTEGTLFLDIYVRNISSQTNDPVIFAFSDSCYLEIYSNGGVVYVDGTAGISIALLSYGLTNGRHKFAVGYKNNDTSLYIDGSLAGSDNTGTPTAHSSIRLGYSSSFYLGTIYYNSVQLYKTKLSTIELAQLTTL